MCRGSQKYTTLEQRSTQHSFQRTARSPRCIFYLTPEHLRIADKSKYSACPAQLRQHDSRTDALDERTRPPKIYNVTLAPPTVRIDIENTQDGNAIKSRQFSSAHLFLFPVIVTKIISPNRKQKPCIVQISDPPLYNGNYCKLRSQQSLLTKSFSLMWLQLKLCVQLLVSFV